MPVLKRSHIATTASHLHHHTLSAVRPSSYSFGGPDPSNAASVALQGTIDIKVTRETMTDSPLFPSEGKLEMNIVPGEAV